MSSKTVRVGDVTVGDGRGLVLIAGPCVIESEALLMDVARGLKEICRRLGVPLILKSSYDKANRSSPGGYRGPGIEDGLAIAGRVKESLGLPLLLDVHTAEEVGRVAETADLLQIPAFLCRQTDLLAAACRSGRPVNVKKGQFLAPWDVSNIVAKFEAFKGAGLILTERGSSFGYNNLVSDMRSLPIMRCYGHPVIFDATHSVQLPGGLGSATGGQREFVSHLARAAAAVGCDGLFLEVHTDPDKAKCDAANQVSLGEVGGLLEECVAIDRIVRQAGNGEAEGGSNGA